VKRRIAFITLAMVVMAIPLLISCSPAATPPAPPTPPAEVKTLKVGASLPFTDSMGIDTKKALEMIVPAFNKAGGLTVKGQQYNLDYLPYIYDDKYTADGGRAAVERLVNEDKVKFIVGQIGSAPIVAGLTVTEPARVLVFGGGASDKIINPNNKYVFGTAVWRTNLPPLFPYLKQAFPNARTIVNLSPDDETGKNLARDNSKVAAAAGFTVLDSVYYPRPTQDFAPFATKVVSLNPDVVNFPGTAAGTPFGLQLKALYEAGYKGGLVSPMPPNLPEVLSVAPREALEGMVTIMPPTEVPTPTPMASQYQKDWTARYGQWSVASLQWIPAFYAFVEAIKKADSLDPEAVASYISANGLSWESPNGKAMLVKRPDYKNDRFCDTVSSLNFGKFIGGKYEFLGSISAEDLAKANEAAFGGGSWK